MGLRSTCFAAAIALIVTGAAATETVRTSGAYVSLTTRDAAACARACADDGICMAWTFQRDQRCQLSAVVPSAMDSTALAAGFASRAPAFLQPRVSLDRAERAPQPPPGFLVAAEAEASPPADAGKDHDMILLGGPRDGDLRPGMR